MTGWTSRQDKRTDGTDPASALSIYCMNTLQVWNYESYIYRRDIVLGYDVFTV